MMNIMLHGDEHDDPDDHILNLRRQQLQREHSGNHSDDKDAWDDDHDDDWGGDHDYGCDDDGCDDESRDDHWMMMAIS